MTSTISYDSVARKTADDLFEEYSVENLGDLMTRLSADVNTKKQKLKLLVGNKYRDLLNVADDIITMNEITSAENEKLMKLAFKRSDYNSKSLSNLSKFNAHLSKIQAEKVQEENRPMILRNVVHDLNYSLITLKHNLISELQSSEENYCTVNDFSAVSLNNQQSMDLDDGLDYYQTVSTPVSNKFVLLAKHIYLIRYLFQDEVENQPKLFAVVKYKQLCGEFNDLLESNIISLKHEADSDFILNLFVSYLIANDLCPIDVLKKILEKRLAEFKSLVTTRRPFQELLNYVFVTIQFMNFIQSRVQVTISRLQNAIGPSNWVQQTSFQKWSKWLHKNPTLGSDNDIQVQYKFEANSDRIGKGDFADTMRQWKIDVSQLLLDNFNAAFDKSSENLTELVILLRYALISFKHFTSLSSLPVGSDNIVDYLIEKWRKEFLVKLTSKLNEFENIGRLILETFNNEELINCIVNSSSESCLYEFDDEFRMGELLQFSGDKSSNDQVFVLLDAFKQDLKSTGNSIDSLKTLSTLVLKPLLSIDDYEDDDFWVKVSMKLKDILSESVNSSISILNKSISSFFDKVSSLLEESKSGVSNTRIFYMIRILVQLEEKIQLNEFYETFSTHSNTLIDNRIKLSELIEPLLANYFKVIVDSIFNAKYASKLENLLKERFEPSKDYAEFMLWENISNEKRIPTTSSIEYSELLLSFCSDLISASGKSYSNYFILPSFEKVRQETVKLLISKLNGYVNTLNEAEINANDGTANSKLLLTYADCLFTNFFLSTEVPGDESHTKFAEIFKPLADANYRKQITYSILENYKNQSLIYYPLSI